MILALLDRLGRLALVILALFDHQVASYLVILALLDRLGRGRIW